MYRPIGLRLVEWRKLTTAVSAPALVTGGTSQAISVTVAVSSLSYFEILSDSR
jgi:hypothetical protein